MSLKACISRGTSRFRCDDWRCPSCNAYWRMIGRRTERENALQFHASGTRLYWLSLLWDASLLRQNGLSTDYTQNWRAFNDAVSRFLKALGKYAARNGESMEYLRITAFPDKTGQTDIATNPKLRVVHAHVHTTYIPSDVVKHVHMFADGSIRSKNEVYSEQLQIIAARYNLRVMPFSLPTKRDVERTINYALNNLSYLSLPNLPSGMLVKRGMASSQNWGKRWFRQA